MNRTRLNIFLQADQARRLAELSAMEGKSRSSIVASALRAFLAPGNGDQRDYSIAKHLLRLSQQLNRLQRDQRILIEAVSMYIQYAMASATPLPEALQEAARVQGRVRFEQFIRQLGQQVRGESKLFKHVQAQNPFPMDDAIDSNGNFELHSGEDSDL